MRYGIIPTRLAERLALWFGRVPVGVVDSLLPLVQTRSLMAAVRLGIADAIGTKEVSAVDVARSCNLDAGAVDMLLRVLVSAGYVAVCRGSSQKITNYCLSSLGRRTLLRGSPLEARGYMMWNFVQWNLVENLEELLQTGRGLNLHETLHGEQVWHWYQEAMLDVSRIAAPIIAKLVPVKPEAEQLLDIGGSHGLLGAAICRRHPPMRSIVLDLPVTIEQARAIARRAGVDDVVEYRAGNVLKDELPADVDVVLLANVIHHFTKDEAIRVLQKARAAMKRGGTVAIWDFDRPSPDAPPELVADVSALYFKLTSTSQVVSGDEYAAWLREAGFEGVSLKRSLMAPVQVLAMGKCPHPQ
jgi:2-polyprenyl-3-methyl-5-hydroxy-6-metoxy-1,4-benzoquinol methylase